MDEKALLARALAAAGGSATAAAKAMGVSRRTLLRRIRAAGIEVSAQHRPRIVFCERCARVASSDCPRAPGRPCKPVKPAAVTATALGRLPSDTPRHFTGVGGYAVAMLADGEIIKLVVLRRGCTEPSFVPTLQVTIERPILRFTLSDADALVTKWQGLLYEMQILEIPPVTPGA